MKLRLFPVLAAPFLLGSCDSIDAVGDRVKELKDMRNESTQGEKAADLNAIKTGISKTGPSVQDLAETDFAAFIAEPGRLNIVDYHAEWCGPCKMLAPILTETVAANENVVRLGKINVDYAKELAREQGVSSIPDVRFYVDGKLVHKFVGVPSKAKIEQLISTHSASISPTPAVAGGIEKASGSPSAVIPPKRPANAKPLEEAMKPMEKKWLPPGVTPKK